AIRRKIGMIGNECMGGAPDEAVVAHEINVAVASERGVARPLISGHRHEPARNIELRAKLAEFRPELLRDLEVVALVPAHVQEGFVASEGKVVRGGARANRLAALA